MDKSQALQNGPVENTDREIWRETPGDYYSPAIHVTERGGIGINVGGHVVVLPVKDWHDLGKRKLAALISECSQPASNDFLAGRLFQFLRMKQERPIDPTYWDMHEEIGLETIARETEEALNRAISECSPGPRDAIVFGTCQAFGHKLYAHPRSNFCENWTPIDPPLSASDRAPDTKGEL